MKKLLIATVVVLVGAAAVGWGARHRLPRRGVGPVSMSAAMSVTAGASGTAPASPLFFRAPRVHDDG